MPNLIDTKRELAVIQGICSEPNAKIAVAFWGRGAFSQLQVRSDTKVICNLTMGGTNPYEIEKMLNDGVNIRHNPFLHAKFYLGSSSAVLGSSNASANGLSFQGAETSGWLEANVFIEDGSMINQLRDRFDFLWAENNTQEISSNDLVKAKERWNERRWLNRNQFDQLSDFDSGLGLLEALAREPYLLSDKSIFIAVYDGKISEEAKEKLKIEKIAAKSRGQKPSDIDLFENWDELPNAADIICFYRGPKGGVRYDGIWHMPKIRRENEGVVFCEKSKLSLNIGRASDWKPFIESSYEGRGSFHLEIGEFAEQYIKKREL
ncbi:hypothetical protein ABIE64_004181 [Thalassospira sp. MBR-102]|jgi:hypothetical protein|uniref:phospholipase D family protein n=1 Tax=Thalassospira sp. MBR-102 TaxID=3156466 RepID=UPI00339848D9